MSKIVSSILLVFKRYFITLIYLSLYHDSLIVIIIIFYMYVISLLFNCRLWPQFLHPKKLIFKPWEWGLSLLCFIDWLMLYILACWFINDQSCFFRGLDKLGVLLVWEVTAACPVQVRNGSEISRSINYPWFFFCKLYHHYYYYYCWCMVVQRVIFCEQSSPTNMSVRHKLIEVSSM